MTIFDEVIKNLYEKHFIANEDDPLTLDKKLFKKAKLICSIRSLDETISLREIHHKQINRLISVKGIIIRCSEINPEMIAALFRCCNCHA